MRVGCRPSGPRAGVADRTGDHDPRSTYSWSLEVIETMTGTTGRAGGGFTIKAWDDLRLGGTIRPGGPDWVYLPVEVPAGVGELAVRYPHDRPATPPGGPGPPGRGFVPDPAPARAAGRGRAWYRGDLHTHTVHSDGRRTLAGLAADARAAGLDFLPPTQP